MSFNFPSFNLGISTPGRSPNYLRLIVSQTPSSYIVSFNFLCQADQTGLFSISDYTLL